MKVSAYPLDLSIRQAGGDDDDGGHSWRKP